MSASDISRIFIVNIRNMASSTRFKTICAILIFGFLYLLYYIQTSIDSAECGAVATECLTSKICQCNRNDCKCCDECMKCLGPENKVKCSKHIGCAKKCMNRIVPKGKEGSYAGVEDGEDVLLSHRAHIQQYDGRPEIFSVLTSVMEDEFEWTVVRFDKAFTLEADDIWDGIDKVKSDKNCTVIFWDTCLSWNKCNRKCFRFGAKSARWFHNGCCECVGHKCTEFGISEDRCKLCPDPAMMPNPEFVADNRRNRKQEV